MGDDYNGFPHAVQLLEHTHNLRPGPAVQRAGGLICQQNIRPAHYRPGDGGALLLSARELGRLPVGQIRNAHLFQRRKNRRPAFCPRHPLPEQRQRHILGSGAVLQQRKMLKDKGDLLSPDCRETLL